MLPAARYRHRADRPIAEHEGEEAITGSAILATSLALAITALLTPLAMRAARRFGIVDEPGGRKIHDLPTPLLGGVAITIGLLAAFGISAWTIEGVDWPLFGWIAAAIAIVAAMGFADDLHSLRAGPKLVAQVLAAVVILTATDLGIGSFPVPFVDDVVLGEPLRTILAAVWLIGVTNAFNMVDGIDGLAAGIGSISAAGIVSVGLWVGDPFAVLMGAACLGALLGFLPFNHHPARIFMGDLGSMAVGLGLAVASLSLLGGPQVDLVPAVLLLGVPILDLFVSVFRRVAGRRNPLSGDRDHLHHLLLERGFGQRRTVLDLYGVAIVFALAGGLSARFGEIDLLESAAFFVIPAAFVAFLGLRRRNGGIATVTRLDQEDRAA